MTAVILWTHIDSPLVRRQMELLNNACLERDWRFVPVMDATVDGPVPGFFNFTNETLAAYDHVNLSFNSGRHHNVACHVWDRLGLNTDYVWLVEYDVHFSGDWGWLLSLQEWDTADLVTYDVRCKGVVDTWGGWAGVTTPRPMTRYCSALQLCRLSGSAIEVLREVCTDGRWSGCSEIVIPTAIAAAGLSHRCYCRDFASADTWRPHPNIAPDGRPNTLWHPVKD